MKAIVYTQYGPLEVVPLHEVGKPTHRDRDVLVKVHAAKVNIGDTIMYNLNLPIHGWQKLNALKEKLDLLNRVPEPAIERAASTLLDLRQS